MFFTSLRSFRNDNRGATGIEYGLIVSLIAIVTITGVSGLGMATSNGLNATAIVLDISAGGGGSVVGSGAGGSGGPGAGWF